MIFTDLKMSLRIIITKLDWPIHISMVDKHRNLDCNRYEKCLDKAIRKNWRSFSCNRCSIFKAVLKEKVIIKEEEIFECFAGGSSFYEEGFV